MTALRPIAVVAGDTPAARLVAGATTSLLTAVGRWVEVIPPGADLAPYAAIVLPRSRGWRGIRDRSVLPLLVIDADLLDGAVDSAFVHLLGDAPTRVATVHGIPAVLPRPLPGLRAGTRASGAVAVEAEPGVGYALPVVTSPVLRTVRGFWGLARALEEAVASLVGEADVLYAAPWPGGARGARALTCDLDELIDAAVLAPLVASRRTATLFCCADALGRLAALGPQLEVAAHGDVHRPFADERTNLARIDRMLAAFHAAGLAPRGFSPPNLVYTSALEPLLERFAHLRLGYQERTLGFFPAPLGGAVLTAVSYYPDFMQRYVGAADYGRLLGRFCRWAEATGVLAVPCLHPAVWPDALPRFLDAAPGDAWEATLAEVTDWWQRRRAALALVARDGVGAAPAELALVRTTPTARLDALTPADAEPLAPPRVRAAARVVIAGRGIRVVPAAAEPAMGVDVPLGAGWRPLGWLPRRMRRAAGRVLFRVTNKNGLHASLYDDLGLVPELTGAALHLPVMAPDEPLLVAPAIADVRARARHTLGRLTRARRSSQAVAHA